MSCRILGFAVVAIILSLPSATVASSRDARAEECAHEYCSMDVDSGCHQCGKGYCGHHIEDCSYCGWSLCREATDRSTRCFVSGHSHPPIGQAGLDTAGSAQTDVGSECFACTREAIYSCSFCSNRGCDTHLPQCTYAPCPMRDCREGHLHGHVVE